MIIPIIIIYFTFFLKHFPAFWIISDLRRLLGKICLKKLFAPFFSRFYRIRSNEHTHLTQQSKLFGLINGFFFRTEILFFFRKKVFVPFFRLKNQGYMRHYKALMLTENAPTGSSRVKINSHNISNPLSSFFHYRASQIELANYSRL